jgi:hypothetical protein
VTAPLDDLVARLGSARDGITVILADLVEPVHTITAPAPGQAVMDAEDMYRFEPPRPVKADCAVLRPIVCWDCCTQYRQIWNAA